MSQLSMGKARTLLDQTFIEDVNDMNEDELASQVIRALIKKKNLTEEMVGDERIQAAKQLVKDLEGGYKDSMKMYDAKVGYILDKIKEIQEGNVNPHASV